jgi:drug/metabolite transporter (DMT)-like permease
MKQTSENTKGSSMNTSSKIHSSLTRGYSAALISAVFLSTTAIFIRHLSISYQLPALVLAFWRNAFVVLTLLVFFRLLRPNLLGVRRNQLVFLAVYGLVLSFFNATWTLSVAWNGAAAATVLVYSSAGFTALLGWWLLKEHLSWAKIVAVCFSLGGCVLVSEALDPAVWRTNVIGISAGVLSGLFYAIYSLMGRSASQRGLSPWTTLLYTFSFAGLFLLVYNLLPGGILPGAAARPADLFWLGSEYAGWAVLFLLAAIPTVAGFGLYNVSLSYLPSSVANLIVTLEPAFTAAIAFALFGERLNTIQLIGGFFILSAVVLMRLYHKERPERPAGRVQSSTPVPVSE